MGVGRTTERDLQGNLRTIRSYITLTRTFTEIIQSFQNNWYAIRENSRLLDSFFFTLVSSLFSAHLRPELFKMKP